MSTELMNNCLAKIKKFFEQEDTTKDSRIESAKITSNRLRALQRMRENSPTTPDYKLETEDAPVKSKAMNDIDLDFGMNIR